MNGGALCDLVTPEFRDSDMFKCPDDFESIIPEHGIRVIARTNVIELPGALRLAKNFLLQHKKSLLREQIESFRRLPTNWDSYGSGPINEVSVSNALTALEKLYQASMLPETVSATSDESVLFEIPDGQSEVIVEFFKGGEIVVLDKRSDVKRLSKITVDEVDKMVSELKNGRS
jgi:hypothetical protein